MQKGDQSVAEEHYTYLLGQRGTMIYTVSSVDRLLGLLSQIMGEANRDSGLAQLKPFKYYKLVFHNASDMVWSNRGEP